MGPGPLSPQFRIREGEWTLPNEFLDMEKILLVQSVELDGQLVKSPDEILPLVEKVEAFQEKDPLLNIGDRVEDVHEDGVDHELHVLDGRLEDAHGLVPLRMAHAQGNPGMKGQGLDGLLETFPDLAHYCSKGQTST